MSERIDVNIDTAMKRPAFPKRAVVTGGMPYGGKKLHFGHVGGMFVHADIYARFLRDRIGRENVIFVSGTDCYGSESEVKFEAKAAEGFTGSIEDFIEENHLDQKRVLESFGVSLDLFAASGMYDSKDIHAKTSAELFKSFHDGGYLRVDEVKQFYTEETGKFLNGRQVEGRCPIQGCKSEKAYADECALGHQFTPEELIAPIDITTGKTPSLRAVKNWYFDLERFSADLKKRQEELRGEGISRRTLLTIIDDFLRDPAILVKTDDYDGFRKICEPMPPHKSEYNGQTKSATLTFTVLSDREKACSVLRENGIRYRTGTTLVPFRLSGNVKWGIPVPEYDGIKDQTFWVWPESLWAPISFVKTFLKRKTGSEDGWTDFWFNPDARVYQFIGEDNIYFYAVAAMGLFMAVNTAAGREPGANLPTVIPNKHLFYGNKKLSSSGAVKPPKAEELLDFYTPEQLRMHFAHMALQSNSVSLNPKAMIEGQTGFDATLAEGNILTNVYNRIVRSCFYSIQKYTGGRLPGCSVSEEAREITEDMISQYEWAMYRFEFSRVIDLLDVYLRDANKTWAAKTKEADTNNDEALRNQILVDTFHVVKTAATLLHPFAPFGTETVREYLNVDERLWDWDYIYKPLNALIEEGHAFKFLEPRVDFFEKHPSQLA